MPNLKLSFLTNLDQWFPEKTEAISEDDPNDPLVATAQRERHRIRSTFDLLFNQSRQSSILHNPEICRELVRNIQFRVLFPLADLDREFYFKDKLKREQLETEAMSLVSGLKYRSWQIYMMGDAIKEDKEWQQMRIFQKEQARYAAEKKEMDDLKERKAREVRKQANRSLVPVVIEPRNVKPPARRFSEMSIAKRQVQLSLFETWGVWI